MTRNPRGAMQSVSVEFELKLSSRSEDLAALYDSSFIVARARGEPSDRCLKTAYYDTADQGLHRAGMTLRVRCEGQTFVQTLKTDSLEGAPMRRREWQAPVPTMAPVPSALADRLPKALRSALGANGLRPVFTTTFRRRQRALDIAGASVEVAFDQGVIEARNHRVPISEIELALKSGAPAALYELALQLLDHHAFKVGGQRKADRGYALALNAAPVSANAPPTILDPEKAISPEARIPRCIIGLLSMHELAAILLKDAVDAYAQRDAERARGVWMRDADLDALEDSVFRDLLTFMMEDPRNISFCTHLLFCSKNIERIGDHSTNIAEMVVYIVTGESLPMERPKGRSSTSVSTATAL